MARAKHNPFASLKRRMPHRALMKRDAPFVPADLREIEAACQRIAAGAEFVSFAGSRGGELGFHVYGFDTADKARAMQEWIQVSGIASRPLPRMADSARLGPIQWEASKSKEGT